MKRPSFQFYPADWRNNAKLRRCSEAARGAWIDVLCLLHDSDEYGVLRWPLADIARALGLPLKLLKELADKEVLKGSDKGAEDYVFRPRHAGKEGPAVTLMVAGTGPCWYCTRFLRDEHVRQTRGAGTRFKGKDSSPDPSPTRGIGERQGDGVGVEIGPRQGDGASTTSTTPSPSLRSVDGDGRAGAFPMQLDWQPSDAIWSQYATLAGIHRNRLTNEILTEFRIHWHANGSFASEAEWVKRLVYNVKRNTSEVPHGTRQHAAAPRGFEHGDSVGNDWLQGQQTRVAQS